MPGDRTFAPYLTLPLTNLGASILTPRHLEDLDARLGALDIGDHVPPPVGIEVPLEKYAPGVDLSLGFASGFGNKAALLSLAPPDRIAETPAWRQMQRWLTACDGSSDETWRSIDNLWLEFDFIDAQSPGPSFYFSLRGSNVLDPSTPITAKQVGSASTPGLEDSQIETLRDVFSHLLPEGATVTAGLDRLTECLRCYRTDTPYVLCGAMLARQDTAQRLCVRFGTIPQVVAYLEDIGVNDFPEAVTTIHHELGDLASHVLVGLDVGATVAPRIGIEIYAGDGLCKPDGTDHELVTRLVEHGYCHPDIATAILDYPGWDVIEGSAETWPVVDARDAGLTPDLRMPICLRRFHHVKIGLAPDRRSAAKAYLSALYRWWSPGHARFA